MRLTVGSSLGFTLAAVMLVAWPASASAQTYICPSGAGPGEHQVGTTGGGATAPMPVCMADAPPSAGGGGTGAQSAGASTTPRRPSSWRRVYTGAPTYAAVLERITAALGVSAEVSAAEQQAAEARTAAQREQLAAAEARMAELRRDPRYAAYQNGAWEHFRATDRNPAPGDDCYAFFWSQRGMIFLRGPSGDYRGAMLTFLSNDIPRPNTPALVPVQLDQGGSIGRQTVRAFNFAMPDTPMGAIAFAVPSVDAMLAGMLDSTQFQLALDGRQVFDMGWHDGLAARDQFRQCVAGR